MLKDTFKPEPKLVSKTSKKDPTSRYTVLNMFRQLLFWAGDQGYHQNFYPSTLPRKKFSSPIGGGDIGRNGNKLK